MERRGIRPGINAMHGVTASSSTATDTRVGRLPLVDCPSCRVRIVMIRSKQPETFGEVFYKCPNNIKEDPRTCNFIRSQEQYERYLRGREAEQASDASGELQHCLDGIAEMRTKCDDMKGDLVQMKQQLHLFAMDISSLKMQRGQFKIFGMDTSVLVGLCVGVVLGMLVSAVIKTI